jgi:F-type H+-transporting ATPase subunit b
MFLLAFAEQSIQLFPDGTIFIHIAMILVMIWVLNRTLFRPINRVIEEREKQKGSGGGEADKLLSEAAEKESRYNKAMLEARSEGYELIEKERAAAVAQRQTTVARTKEETSAALSEQKAQLEAQTLAARTAIAAEAEQLADKIAANILKA